MKQHDHFGSDQLRPEEIEFILLYLTNGMNGTKAAIHTFGLSSTAAGSKAHILLIAPGCIRQSRQRWKEECRDYG